jgi:hypothetical protein
MRALERRVSSIEQRATAAAPIVVFTDPDEAALTAALARGNRVIVAHADWPSSRREVVGGIEHMSVMVAGLTQLAGSPSKHGRASALDDFFIDLQGRARVFGPVPI